MNKKTFFHDKGNVIADPIFRELFQLKVRTVHSLQNFIQINKFLVQKLGKCNHDL